MLRGLFITGTDTGVGKTTVAAALMHRYRELRVLKYWKPIQTGIEVDDDTRTVGELGHCRDEELHREGIRLPRPLAPYLSAKLSGTHVTIADLMSRLKGEADSVRWVVEGAGGVLVPINESESMIDLIATVEVPTLIVARSSLGTINHTLLTVEALRRRRLDIAGVVMVGQENAANREAIERFGSVTVVDEMPYFTSVTGPELGAWATSAFDREGTLARYFK
jgi:dethiobiotin synthetase